MGDIPPDILPLAMSTNQADCKCIGAVVAEANKFINKLGAGEKIIRKDEYEQWKRDGLVQLDLYQYDWFRPLYVKDLFTARKRTQRKVLTLLRDNISVVGSVLDTCQTVCCIGCGAGADIVGAAGFLQRRIEYIAIDAQPEWFDYIRAFIDLVGTASYYQGTFDCSTVSNVPQADVALISYAHSNQHPIALLDKLTTKFRLIVIQEVFSTEFDDKMRACGFTTVSHELKLKNTHQISTEFDDKLRACGFTILSYEFKHSNKQWKQRRYVWFRVCDDRGAHG